MARAGQEEEIAEIGRVRVSKRALIGVIDAGTRSQIVGVDRKVKATGVGNNGFDPGRRILWRDQVVLELGEAVAQRLEWIATGRAALSVRDQVHRLQNALYDAAAIVSVQDVEPGPQPCDLGFRAQLPGAEAVEGSDPVRGCVTVEGDTNAPGHLARCLVGECHGQDPQCLEPGYDARPLRSASWSCPSLPRPAPEPGPFE